MESKMMLQKNSFCGERNHMGQKNRESEKTTITDNSSGSKHIHVFFYKKTTFCLNFLNIMLEIRLRFS